MVLRVGVWVDGYLDGAHGLSPASPFRCGTRRIVDAVCRRLFARSTFSDRGRDRIPSCHGFPGALSSPSSRGQVKVLVLRVLAVDGISKSFPSPFTSVSWTDRFLPRRHIAPPYVAWSIRLRRRRVETFQRDSGCSRAQGQRSGDAGQTLRSPRRVRDATAVLLVWLGFDGDSDAPWTGHVFSGRTSSRWRGCNGLVSRWRSIDGKVDSVLPMAVARTWSRDKLPWRACWGASCARRRGQSNRIGRRGQILVVGRHDGRRSMVEWR